MKNEDKPESNRDRHKLLGSDTFASIGRHRSVIITIGYIFLFFIPIFSALRLLLTSFSDLGLMVSFFWAAGVSIIISYYIYTKLKEGPSDIFRQISTFSTPRLIVVSLIVASFYTTSTGIVSIAKDEGSIDGIWEESFVRYFVLVMTIALAIAARGIFMPQKFLSKIFTFVTWALLAFFSMQYSFGFFWDFLQAKSVSRAEAREALSEADDQLNLLSSVLDQAISMSQTLSVSSKQLAFREKGIPTNSNGEPLAYNPDGSPQKLEGFGGDTCERQTRTIEGPRARMRDDLARELNNNARLLDDFRKDLAKTMDEIDKDFAEIRDFQNQSSQQSETDRVALIDRANLNLRDAEQAYSSLVGSGAPLDRIAIRYESLSYNFLDTSDIFTLWGEPFSCPDQGFASQLQATAENLRRLPELELGRINAYSGSEATKEAISRFSYTILIPFRVVGNFISSLFRGGPTLNDYPINDIRDNAESIAQNNNGTPMSNVARGFQDGDGIPLFGAALVDFLLFFFTFKDPASRRFATFFLTRKRWKASENSDPLVDIETLRQLQQNPNYLMIEQHLVRFSDMEFIVIPMGNLNQNNRALLSYLDTLRQSHIVKRTQFMLFFPRFRRAIKEQVGFDLSPNNFHVYRLEEGTLAEIYMAHIAKTSS